MCLVQELSVVLPVPLRSFFHGSQHGFVPYGLVEEGFRIAGIGPSKAVPKAKVDFFGYIYAIVYCI